MGRERVLMTNLRRCRYNELKLSRAVTATIADLCVHASTRSTFQLVFVSVS